MNIRKLIKFLFNTLLIGATSGLVVSFFVKWDTYAMHLNPFNGMELLGLVVFFTGLGITFSVVSMTGYFAYLFLHRFGLSVFRSFWNTVQILLILFVLFDLIYFPSRHFAGEISFFWFILGTATLFFYAWIVAKLKIKETNKSAFVPALFFIIVVTTAEWTPALIAESSDYVWMMLAPLLACNTYQLIGSHRIANRVDGKSAKDPAREKMKTSKVNRAQTSRA